MVGDVNLAPIRSSTDRDLRHQGTDELDDPIGGAGPTGGLDSSDSIRERTGRLWIEEDELNPIDVADGVAPVAAGEIAVDQGLAGDQDLQLGDQTTILILVGQFDVTVVGITSFGNGDAQDAGGTVSIPESTAFDWLNAGQAECEAARHRRRVGG